MQFLDAYGYPVVTFKGRPVVNFIRRLLWTRQIKRGKWTPPPQSPSTNVMQSNDTCYKEKVSD